MQPLLKTLLWTIGTAVVVFSVTSLAGYFFLTGHENAHAVTILTKHSGAVVSIYARILLGYVLAGGLLGFFLHPFVRGWKAALALLGIGALALLHTLTDETHLLYGPVQSLFCAVHDTLPAWLRNLYEPWLLELAFGLFVLWSLHRWTLKVPLRWKAGVAVAVVGVVAFQFLPETYAAGEPGKRPTCFLLIATDSLRADHLSCNGYERKTSPHIDALAARGTNFQNCLVPTASTHESWVTLFASKEPREHGLRHMFPTRAQCENLRDEQVWLPKLLGANGYKTGAIGGWCGTTFGLIDMGVEHIDVSESQNHSALIAEAAFTNHLLAAAFLDNPVGRAMLPELNRVSFTRSAGAITGRAQRWLADRARGDEPFFLTVVYHVTHLPYSASYPYYTVFTDPDYRGRNRYRIDFKIDEMIQRGFDHDLTAAEKQHIKDLYDGTVREFDDQVGALVQSLKDLGLLENTIVGVWGDHGDDLYEHGTTLGHGVTLFGGDQANKPPAVFAGPGVPHRTVKKLVREIDLAPTWLGWLGHEAPKTWSGIDLRGDIPDFTVNLETSYLLYRQPVPDLLPGEKVKEFPQFDQATFIDDSFDGNLVLRPELNDALIATKCLAVRRGPWKLISVPGENGAILRLFHLPSDPECKKDRRADQPGVLKELLLELPERAR